MHRREYIGLPVCSLLWNTVPDGINHVFVGKTFIDAVTADQKVIKIVFQLECRDFWLTDHNVRVSSVPRFLCFDVAESSRNWQTAWENSQWALNIEVLFIWAGCSLCKCLGAINLSSTGLYPQPFLLIIGLVVPGKHCNLAPCIHAHDDSAVSNVYYVGSVIYYHNYCRARTRTFGTNLLAGILMLGALLGLLNELDETSFAFFEPQLYGFLRVHRELLILDHKIVQVIPEIISTGSSTMAIKNSEKANLGPLNFELGLWFRF